MRRLIVVFSATQHSIFEEKPDIYCNVAASVCHDGLKTSRKNNHDPSSVAAFGDVVLERKPHCDESVAYTVTMCLKSSLDSQPVEAPVTCYDYDGLNKNDLLAEGTTSATDGCIVLSYDTSG